MTVPFICVALSGVKNPVKSASGFDTQTGTDVLVGVRLGVAVFGASVAVRLGVTVVVGSTGVRVAVGDWVFVTVGSAGVRVAVRVAVRVGVAVS